jgi:hypothetical protein
VWGDDGAASDDGGLGLNLGLAVNVIAVLISVSAVTASSLFALHQLRSMRRSDDTLVAIELLTRECRTTEFLTSEDFVLNELSKEPAEGGIAALSPEARRHISRIGLYYSSLGFLSVFGGLQEKMVVSLMPWRVRRAWFAMEPYIMAERALRSPTHFAFFEHLVCMVAEADVAEIHESLQLRKIGTRSARFRRELRTRPGLTPLPEDRPEPEPST